MFIFILSALSALITAFLVMVAVQLLRIEKTISECVEIAEIRVKKLYVRN